MPIYEYHCRKCGHSFELMQKISDPPATQCPVCLEHEVEKLVSAPSFQLKGAGWYETDFKNKASSTAGGSETSAVKSSSSDNSSKSKGDKA